MRPEGGYRADARANRVRLIEAARAVFAERGLAAEMKEIAERAGVGVGTIYRNFATKSDLVVALVADFMARLKALLSEAEASGAPGEGLRAFIEGSLELMESHGSLVAEAHVVHEMVELIAPDDRAEVRTCLAALVREGVASGDFRADVDPEFAADYLDAMFAAACMGLRQRYPVPELGRKLSDLILRGLEVATAPAP